MVQQSIEDGEATLDDVEQAVNDLDIRSTTVHHELIRGVKTGEITDLHLTDHGQLGIFFNGDAAAKSNIVRYLPDAGLRIQTVHFENAGFFVEVSN